MSGAVFKGSQRRTQPVLGGSIHSMRRQTHFVATKTNATVPNKRGITPEISFEVFKQITALLPYGIPGLEPWRHGRGLTAPSRSGSTW